MTPADESTVEPRSSPLGQASYWVAPYYQLVNALSIGVFVSTAVFAWMNEATIWLILASAWAMLFTRWVGWSAWSPAIRVADETLGYRSTWGTWRRLPVRNVAGWVNLFGSVAVQTLDGRRDYIDTHYLRLADHRDLVERMNALPSGEACDPPLTFEGGIRAARRKNLRALLLAIVAMALLAPVIFG